MDLPTITDTLLYSGDTEKQVDIKVCQEVFDYSGTPINDDCVTIPVIVRNPCLNDDLVEIKCPDDLEALTYIVSSGREVFSSHAECEVITKPIDHNLCGKLKYTPFYDN